MKAFLCVALCALTGLIPVTAPADAAAEPAASATGPAASLHRILDEEWQWRLHEFPEMATSVGDHRYDDRLTDASPAAIAARRAHHQQFLTALRQIDRKALQGEDQLSLDIFLFDAGIDVAQDQLLTVGSPEDHPFSANDSPLDLNQMGGPQFSLLELPRIAQLRTVEDYRRYLARLAALPRSLRESQALLEAGRRSGWMPPRVTVRALPEQFAGVLVEDPARHPLLSPFAAVPEGFDPAVFAQLKAEGETLLRSQLLPALRGFRDYLATRWVPAATSGTGAPQLPDGKAWYALQLRRYTTTDMGAEEIHALGLREVARIQDEIRKVLKDADFHGTVAEFRTFLLNDPRFRYASAEDELRAFRDLSKQVDPLLPGLFAELPRLPYGIRPMHAEEGNNAPHYTPGASDGSRAGYFDANTNNLAGQPNWSIQSLFLHETVPGHHLQTARAQELHDLPELRRNYWNSAYGEGWALYSESLGDRLGLYKDPYARFGRLADESLRAARLVVDTGLHAKGWTRQQAIDYLIEFGQQERGYAEAEIDRYLVWPGQATAYKIGELRILALRQQAEAELGARFDIRRFHNAVLDHGALPLTVLAGTLGRWVEDERARATTAPAPAAGSPLRALMDQEWEWRLAQFPERATELGDHRYDDRLTDQSAAAVAARRTHHRAWRDALQRIDPATLQGEDRISWQIFSENADLAVQIDTMLTAGAVGELPPWSADDSPMAVNQMSGPQFALPQLVRASRFDTVDDYRHYLSRLAALPQQLEQLRAVLEAGRLRGWMPPKVAIARLPDQFKTLLERDLAHNPLYAPFQTLPAGFAAAEAEALRAEAAPLFRTQLIPALQTFRDYLATTWVPAARASTAAVDLPGGPAWYQLMLQRANTTRLAPDEIHRIGLAEVARLDEEIRKVMVEAGFKGSRAEFRTWLRTDPSFQFASAEQELSAIRDLAKRVDPLLPGLFAELPRVPYGVRPMQPEEGNNAPHYVPGALDGSRAGYFEANLNSLSAWPKWTMEALFLHEAVPGHHLQIARAQELAGLPALRRGYFNSGYIEGWGLYSEGLGRNLGLYTDPYSRFGRLSLEAHRACRLVIDTGLHSQGWTRQQAIDYLIEHANLEQGFAEAEIDRYLVWPGQATAYKLGELRILALRARAREALGERFDLRRFHNAVLDHGVLPLTVLEQVIDQWIAEQGGRTGAAPAAAGTGPG